MFVIRDGQALGIEEPPPSRIPASRTAREHHLRHGRERWDVVLVDALMDDIGNVMSFSNAVALYDCSSSAEGRFVALVAADDLLACDETHPVSVAGAWTLNPPVLAQLKNIIKEDWALVR